MSARRAGLLPIAFASLLVSSPVLCFDEVPLQDWVVPARTGGPLTPLADIGYPAIFVSMVPCRVVDTRNADGAYGGPKLSSATVRSFLMTGSSCTGIPAGASSYSLNLTVTQTNGAGFVNAYPKGGSVGTTSSVNYTGAGQTVANAAIVPAGTGGDANSISVVAGVSGTHLVIDINGYFMGGGGSLNSGEMLYVQGSYSGGAMVTGANYSTGTGKGVLGQSWGTSTGACGVGGLAAGATGKTYGVTGEAESSTDGTSGVYGTAQGGGKVYGVQGVIWSTATKGAAGVYGSLASATTAITSGVLGESRMTLNDSAGVIGRDGAWLPAFTDATASAGVRGESALVGVAGVTGDTGRGVLGMSLTAGGAAGPYGYLGNATWAVYASGNMGASGTKPFVEPHPYKPGTVIRYVALEGPEAGTYFRGRGTFVGGKAVIEVPESFRLVTDEEGITVQITPIGRATAWVNRIGLDNIEAEGSRDVEFSYLVQGIRRTFKDWQVEVASEDFMPPFPTSTIPGHLSEGQRRNLIQAGVYNEDGTVNMATARRLGWDKVWERQAKGE